MGPPSYMRSVVDRNVMRRILDTNVFSSLPRLRVMEDTRCATVAPVCLQNCVSAWVRLNYVSFLTTASQVSGCCSWPGRDFGACLSIKALATPGRPFGDTGNVGSSSFLFVLCLLKLLQNTCCVCVYLLGK
jgi:hypothetical protein